MAKLNHEQIAVNLLTTGSYKECAEKSGISLRTLGNLRKRPEFIELVEQLKVEMFKESMQKAQATSLKALQVLNEIMMDKNATDSSRVSACRTVLELALNSAEQELIMDKLEYLEGMCKR